MSETNGNLDTRAMLADLSIGGWTGRMIDRQTAVEVTKDANASADAGAWWTRLVPPAALKAVEAAGNRARAVHNKFTLPWSDSGPRVLPAAAYMDYTGAVRSCREAFEKAADDFASQYPSLVASAPARLGDLLKGQKFPDAAAIRARFYFRVDISPLPTAGDFRVDLGGEAITEIRGEIERKAAEAREAAARDLWERLYAVVTRIAEKLKDPDAVFHKSMLEKTVELCDLLPKLNVTGDPDLEKARQEVLAKLAGRDAATLRTDKPARAEAAAEAARIAAGMAAFFKPAE